MLLPRFFFASFAWFAVENPGFYFCSFFSFVIKKIIYKNVDLVITLAIITA